MNWNSSKTSWRKNAESSSLASRLLAKACGTMKMSDSLAESFWSLFFTNEFMGKSLRFLALPFNYLSEGVAFHA